MKIKTIGEILRTQRQQHNVTIEQLSKVTHIRVEYLRALEENQFEKLPSAVFVRGYIKSYSHAFGFDYQPLVALLRRDFKESAAGTLVPREFIKPTLKKRQFWTPITLAVLSLAVVFLSLIGYIGLQWYNLQKPPLLTITSPIENAFVSSNIIVKGQTVPDGIVAVNAQPVALQSDGSFQTEVYIPREGIHVITIEALDRRGKKNVVQVSVHVRF